MLYYHNIEVFRPKVEPNENGIVSTVFEKVVKGKCHLSVKSVSSGIESPNTTQKQEFKIFCPIIDIQVGDKLIINTGFHTYEFKAHQPFAYKLLKKLEVVVDQWQE